MGKPNTGSKESLLHVCVCVFVYVCIFSEISLKHLWGEGEAKGILAAVCNPNH